MDDISDGFVILTDENVTQEFTYTLLVMNSATSNVTAANVVVNDLLPERLTGISATPSTGTCTIVGDLVNCELGSMAPGQGETIEIVVSITRLEEGEVGAAFINNIATVSTPDPETTLVNNVDNEILDIIEVFALEETLPVTGADSGRLAWVGLVLLALGRLLLLGARKGKRLSTSRQA